MNRPTKGQRITTLVFALLKIAIGIVTFALFKRLIDVAVEIASSPSGQDIPATSLPYWWIYGLPFVVPGLIGVITFFAQNGVSYGMYMASCIIACIVDAVFCFLSFVFLFAMAAVGGLDCAEVGGKCYCKTGNNDLPSDRISINDCDDLSSLLHISYGLCAMMIIGWLLCLAGSIVSCATCCCGMPQEPQVVMMTSYPGQVTVAQHSSPPPEYMPPAGAQYMAPGEEMDDKTQYKYNRMY